MIVKKTFNLFRFAAVLIFSGTTISGQRVRTISFAEQKEIRIGFKIISKVMQKRNIFVYCMCANWFFW